MTNKPWSKLNILIAEDDEDDAETIKEAFRKNEWFGRIDIVNNGEEALKFLNNNRFNLPHVILTDFNMPIKNGYEVLCDVSNDRLLKTIPFFVYSTTIHPKYVLQCKTLGARDFLVKPFNLNHFDLIPETIILNLASAEKNKV